MQGHPILGEGQHTSCKMCNSASADGDTADEEHQQKHNIFLDQLHTTNSLPRDRMGVEKDIPAWA